MFKKKQCHCKQLLQSQSRNHQQVYYFEQKVSAEPLDTLNSERISAVQVEIQTGYEYELLPLKYYEYYLYL